MNVKETLIKAKALIDTPEKWTQNVFSNPEETCFCALGAIGKVCNIPKFRIAATPASLHLCSIVSDQLTATDSFAVYNDNHTHAEVMAVFDKAIETAPE